MDYDRSPLSKMHQQKEDGAPETEAANGEETYSDRIANAGSDVHQAAISQAMPTAQRANVVSRIQRMLGNAYVQRLIQRAQSNGLQREDDEQSIGREGGVTGKNATDAIEKAKSDSTGAIPSNVARAFEGVTGVQTSGITVTRGPNVDQAGEHINALGWTQGNRIFETSKVSDHNQFYSHEMTHATGYQQQDTSIGDGSGVGVTSADHPNEHVADKVSSAVVNSISSGSSGGGMGGAQRMTAGVQRDDDEDAQAMRSDVQREEDEDAQAMRTGVQREEDEDAQAMRSDVQREDDEDAQAMRSDVQRQDDEDAQAMRVNTVQRQDDEDAQMMRIQRQGSFDEKEDQIS